MGTSYLALGYECNHKCICCPLTTFDRLHKKLSYEEVVERILQINENQEQEVISRHIVLSGGEPMLHPDFLKILEFIVREGFHVTILSNSSRCVDKRFVMALKEIISQSKVDIVTAIHSSTPSIHDKITGVSGSLLETLEGLDNLVATDIPVTIKHIFHKMSIKTLLDTFQYLEKHYPPQVEFQFCTMDYSGQAAKNKEKLYLTIPEIQPYIEAVLDYLENNMVKPRRISFIETPLCLVDPYYWKYFVTSSKWLDTYIAPNAENRELNRKVVSECGAYYEACKLCDVNQWCTGTWKSAFAFGNNILLRPIKKI